MHPTVFLLLFPVHESCVIHRSPSDLGEVGPDFHQKESSNIAATIPTSSWIDWKINGKLRTLLVGLQFTQWCCEVWLLLDNPPCVDRAYIVFFFVHADLTDSVLDYLCRKMISTSFSFFVCNIDIDIQNSLTEIHFPRPIVFRWCITPYCLPLKAPSLTGIYLALLFSIRVERAWWNIGAKHHEIQKLMKFWSRKQAIIIEQIDS